MSSPAISFADSKLENPNRELKVAWHAATRRERSHYDSKLENPNRELKVNYAEPNIGCGLDSKLENPNRELKVYLFSRVFAHSGSDSKLENPNRELKAIFNNLPSGISSMRFKIRKSQ